MDPNGFIFGLYRSGQRCYLQILHSVGAGHPTLPKGVIIRPYLRTNYQQKPTLYQSSRPKNVLPEGSSDNRLTKWVPYNEMAHMLRHAAHVCQTLDAV